MIPQPTALSTHGMSEISSRCVQASVNAQVTHILDDFPTEKGAICEWCSLFHLIKEQNAATQKLRRGNSEKVTGKR